MNKRKGISLIVLVITILVMIILAGVVIVSLSKNNPVEKAKEATFKGDLTAFQDELSIYVVNRLALDSNLIADDINASGYTNVKKLINSFNKKYDGKVEVSKGRIIYIGKDNKEIEWAKSLGMLEDKESTLLPKPSLAQGMQAVGWEGEKEVINPSMWYSYANNLWANAKTPDGSYYVWIPRYAYRIIYYANKADKNAAYNMPEGDPKREEKAIGFSDARGIVDKAGNIGVEFIREHNVIEIKFLGEGANKYSYVENGKYMYDVTKPLGAENPKGYIVHPAFSPVRRNGFVATPNGNYGWDSEINGFWIAKFFMTEHASGEFKSIPGIERTRLLDATETHKAGRSLGAKLFPSNVKVDTMNMKNTHHGAVVMLSLEAINKKPRHNQSQISGGVLENGGYKRNVDYSSTQNVTGVYDLVNSDTAWHMLSSAINNTYFQTNIATKGLVEHVNTRYMDMYAFSAEDTRETNYNSNKTKYGDAIYETTNVNWSSVVNDFPFGEEAMFSRDHLWVGNIPGDAIRDVWKAIIVINN